MSLRWVTLASVAGIAVGAPITAEYLQAYLSSTGDLAAMLIGLLIFTPLYGGAALLIREIAVRTGRGWTGILLLAAGFGVAMPGVVDLAMFGAERPDIPYWAELREPTLIEPLQLSASATLGWVIGHVVMSIGAPLAVHQALVPSVRGRPLLGRWGIAVTLLLWLGAAALVHGDGRSTYDYVPSAGQVVGVLLVVAVLVALAMSRVGQPIRAAPDGRAVSAAWVLGAGVVGKVAFDVLPSSWTGFAIGVGLLGAAVVLLRWFAARRRWSSREIGLLGTSMIIGSVLIGFVAPLPEGVSFAAKLGQGAVFLVLAIAVTAAVYRTTSEATSEERMNG
ncbi:MULTISPECIES: hypothetical protein [Actinoalloteichus]|uniref:Uncharacterized protein n=1 Tax=Actinoalloteichus fjordicus TaxID=1612552 RepID=A0AAC9LA89_9PSEU|nr:MULTISPECIES: hypothetical protein [Actinoalloteichus]APU13676.1 hypothetical protein UA74_08040 [Actinoalloteichus fjordicus]APU19622.1 hypothetical protein UA75_08020 [Actinoalloteichus sp. GBA129-24]